MIDFLSTVEGKFLAVASTGSGKSYVFAGVRKNRPKSLILVPTQEIGMGIARRINTSGAKCEFAPEQQRLHIFTYKVLLNRLRAGKINPLDYDGILRDEAHHLDDTNLQIDEYFPHAKYIIGLTATHYRGTPKETRRLLDYYENRVRVFLTDKVAAQRGVISVPTFEVLPLHNDTEISIVRGDFKAVEVDRMVQSKMEDLATEVAKRYWDPATNRWKRPITVVFSSDKLCVAFDRACRAPTDLCVGRVLTSPTHRMDIFKRAMTRETALVQIKIVGEGVDLPFRIMVDAAPTMSPLFWKQRIGRITRPVPDCPVCQGHPTSYPSGVGRAICLDCTQHPGKAEPPPEYVCTNHNLLRHGYLFEGFVPASTFKDYKAKWPGWVPDATTVSRIIGDVPSLGKYKPAPVQLSDGSTMFCICIDDPTGKRDQYMILVHPATDKTVLAKREWKRTPEGQRDYSQRSKWVAIDEIPDLSGYSSVPASALSPAQLTWWQKSAANVGLDPNEIPSARGFQCMPMLFDTRRRIKV